MGRAFVAYWPVLALCGGAFALLLVIGLASLWAEAVGKRPPPHEDAEDPEEIDGLDGRRRRAPGRQRPEDGEGPAEEDRPPWERPGAVRRDCEPDRGPLLLLLGRLSLWLIAAGLLVGAVVLLAVIPLAVVVLTMASRDRAKMRAGTMDPAGEVPTRKATRYAASALVVCALALLGVGCLVIALVGSFAD